MTAPNTTPRWRLPFRYWDQHPTNPRDIQEWAVEKLVAEFCDTGDEDFFRLLEDRRSDWTCAQVWEAVDRLCALSEIRDEAEDVSRGAREVATVDYLDQLMKIAHRPGQS